MRALVQTETSIWFRTSWLKLSTESITSKGGYCMEENRKVCQTKKKELPFLRTWNDFQCKKLEKWLATNCFLFRNGFLVQIVVLYVNDFLFEMIFLETISIWKWFFLNDLLPQKMISCCFLLKKMIYSCEKSFTSGSEMINYTRKWFRRSPKMIFVEMIFWNICSNFWRFDLLLGKKNI